MAKKVKTLTKLKKDLDSIFSKYIRLKDADDDGYVKCFTSGVVKYWKEIQAGHFQSRRHLNTRWDEMNVKPQTMAENMYNQGNQYTFGLNLDKLYGDGTADELVIKAQKLRKFDRLELEQMIRDYKEEVAYHLDRIGESKS